MTTKDCDYCSVHSKVLERLKYMGELIVILSDLREVTRSLADEILNLHQQVREIRTQEKFIDNRNIRWAIFIPSVVVTISGLTWMCEQVIGCVP